MTDTVWGLLLGFVMLQGVLLAGIFGTHQKGSLRANRLLALFSLLVAFLLSGYVYRLLPFGWTSRGYAAFVSPFWLLLGPLFYSYIRVLTAQPKQSKSALFWHILPFLLQCVPVWHLFFFPTSFHAVGYGRYLFAGQGGATWSSMLYANVLMVQLLGYAVASAWLLWHQEAVRQERLEKSDKRRSLPIHWLRVFFWGFAGYVVYETILSLYLTLSGALTAGYLYFSVFLMSSLLLVIPVLAIRWPELLWPLQRTAQVEAKEPAPKYAHSVLEPAYLAGVAQRLRVAMETEQLFMKSALKLQDVAAFLDVPAHHLTQALNQHLDTNFHAYVNTYRVAAAQERLLDPRFASYTLLAIALDVGFNSKATFNRSFKRATGMTPSAFVSAHQKGKNE